MLYLDLGSIFRITRYGCGTIPESKNTKSATLWASARQMRASPSVTEDEIQH